MTKVLTIEEVAALPTLDAEAFHNLVYRELGGRSETYAEVTECERDSQWPDFEGGVDPIIAGTGLVLMACLNEDQDELYGVFDTAYTAIETEYRPALTYVLFEGCKVVNVALEETDRDNNTKRTSYWLSLPEDLESNLVIFTANLVSQPIRESLGLGDNVLIETGNYGTGFWHNEIRVDLEDLKNGKYSAFTVIESDTAGTSFRAYYGIDWYAKLPSGVDNDAIVDFCASLYMRREELTSGLEIEWDNGNEKAIWYDEDGDNCEPNQYWNNDFSDEVLQLNSREVYDLSFSENYDFVKEAIEPLPEGVDPTDANAVQAHLNTVGYEDDAEMIYTGHADFAARYAQESADEVE